MIEFIHIKITQIQSVIIIKKLRNEFQQICRKKHVECLNRLLYKFKRRNKECSKTLGKL